MRCENQLAQSAAEFWQVNSLARRGQKNLANHLAYVRGIVGLHALPRRGIDAEWIGVIVSVHDDSLSVLIPRTLSAAWKLRLSLAERRPQPGRCLRWSSSTLHHP